MSVGSKNLLLYWFGKFTVGRLDTVNPEDGHRKQPKHVGVVNKQHI
jgi:hypothetical protein